MSERCVRAADDSPTLAAVAARLRVPASLRNGETVSAERQQFVSAELHRSRDDFGVAGDILTWVRDGDGLYRSVDRNARKLSSWPVAHGVDLSTPGARTSRGCVYPLRGHRVCQQSVNAPIPVSGECPSGASTTTSTVTR